MYLTRQFVAKLFRIGILITLILLLLDLLTFFYYPGTPFGEIFLATREQTPLTWISAITLLLIALVSASVYLETKSPVWYLLALSFLFFSMDDATYFHERFSAAMQKSFLFLAEFPSYSWIVIYFPLLAFSLGSLIYLLWKKASQKEKRLLFTAVLFLGVSLILDMVDGWVGKDRTLVFCIDPICHKNITHIFRLTEEIFEVVGFGIFAYLSIIKHSLRD